METFTVQMLIFTSWCWRIKLHDFLPLFLWLKSCNHNATICAPCTVLHLSLLHSKAQAFCSHFHYNSRWKWALNAIIKHKVRKKFLIVVDTVPCRRLENHHQSYVTDGWHDSRVPHYRIDWLYTGPYISINPSSPTSLRLPPIFFVTISSSSSFSSPFSPHSDDSTWFFIRWHKKRRKEKKTKKKTHFPSCRWRYHKMIITTTIWWVHNWLNIKKCSKICRWKNEERVGGMWERKSAWVVKFVRRERGE